MPRTIHEFKVALIKLNVALPPSNAKLKDYKELYQKYSDIQSQKPKKQKTNHDSHDQTPTSNTRATRRTQPDKATQPAHEPTLLQSPKNKRRTHETQPTPQQTAQKQRSETSKPSQQETLLPTKNTPLSQQGHRSTQLGQQGPSKSPNSAGRTFGNVPLKAQSSSGTRASASRLSSPSWGGPPGSPLNYDTPAQTLMSCPPAENTKESSRVGTVDEPSTIGIQRIGLPLRMIVGPVVALAIAVAIALIAGAPADDSGLSMVLVTNSKLSTLAHAIPARLHRSRLRALEAWVRAGDLAATVASPRGAAHILGSALTFIAVCAFNIAYAGGVLLLRLVLLFCAAALRLAVHSPLQFLGLSCVIGSIELFRRALVWLGRARRRRVAERTQRLDEAACWVVRHLKGHHERWHSATGLGRGMCCSDLRKLVPDENMADETAWYEVTRRVRQDPCIRSFTSEGGEDAWEWVLPPSSPSVATPSLSHS